MVLSGDNSKVTSEVNRLLAELPASVHALTGVDLSKVCTFLALGTGEAGGFRAEALTRLSILADTPDQESYWCTGMRLRLTHGLQQLPAPPAPVLTSQGQREQY